MARRILGARKQPRSQSRDANLLAKRVASQIRERYLSYPVSCSFFMVINSLYTRMGDTEYLVPARGNRREPELASGATNRQFQVLNGTY
jgi:hypothetical protein